MIVSEQIVSEQLKRQHVIEDALNARSEKDVEAAIQQMDAWVQEHPEDDSIRDAYEPLILRQMAFTSSPDVKSLPVVLTG